MRDRVLNIALVVAAIVLAGVVILVPARRNRAPGPAASEVLLRWNRAATPIAYRTIMEPLKKSDWLRLDLDRLAQGVPAPEVAKERIASLSVKPTDSIVTVIRSAPGDTLDVKMIHDGDDMLQGTISSSGEMLSFYLPEKTENVTSLLLELPRQSVRVGSTWPLDVNFVQMGFGEVSTAARTNRVTLVSLVPMADGDTLAVLDYHIAEAVKMKVMGDAGSKPGEMAMAFVGRGEFMVNRGVWKRLVGRVLFKSVNIIDRDTLKMALLEVEPTMEAHWELVPMQ